MINSNGLGDSIRKGLTQLKARAETTKQPENSKDDPFEQGANSAPTTLERTLAANSPFGNNLEAPTPFEQSVGGSLERQLSQRNDVSPLLFSPIPEAQLTRDQVFGGPGSILALQRADGELSEASSEQVQESADKIEDLIDSKGWNQWVSRGEIIDAATELTKHDSETTNAIFDELEERNLLDDFFKEAYDAGHVGGGIPGDQRRAFFDEFAAKLSGENLAALTEEVKEVSNFGGSDTVEELSIAIAEHASDEVKLDYINEIKDQVTVNDSNSSYFAWTDTEGAAIARVIAGMDNPDNIEKALAGLNDEQLASVINAGTDRTIVGVGGVIDNSSVYADLAEAVGRIDSDSNASGTEQIERFLHTSADRLRNDERTRNNDPQFKDALGAVFTDHLENLVGSSLTESGAINSEFGQDVETISQSVLFSNPPGENQEAQAEKVASLISGWVEQAQTGNPSDRTSIGDTQLSKENLANVAGQLLFHTTEGLNDAIDQGLADKEARDAVAKFFVNIAFDLVPPAKAGKVVGSIFNQAKGATKNEVLDNITSDDIGVNAQGFDEFYTLLRESIGASQATVVDPDLATIRRAFEDGLDGPS